METINQATNAIKTTIWGENAGTGSSTGHQTEVHKSMIDDNVTETRFSGRTETDPDNDNRDYSLGKGNNDSEYKPEGPRSTGGFLQGANLTGNQGTNQNSQSNSNEPNTGFGGGGAQPSVTADPEYAQQDTTKHQGGDRPNEDPEDSSTSSRKFGDDSTGSGSSGVGGMKLPESDNKSSGEGTGQLYEKSTGLHCDGGDFDASRPGAAREADRLMDEKGVKRGGETHETGEPQKEKKWYGVDHSGFGGHGSHTNKRSSVSKSQDDDQDRHERLASEQSDHHDQYQSRDQYDTSEDRTEKTGLAQKIKDKLHHSSSK